MQLCYMKIQLEWSFRFFITRKGDLKKLSNEDKLVVIYDELANLEKEEVNKTYDEMLALIGIQKKLLWEVVWLNKSFYLLFKIFKLLSLSEKGNFYHNIICVDSSPFPRIKQHYSHQPYQFIFYGFFSIYFN